MWPHNRKGSAMKCTVCTHPQRRMIDVSLLRHTPLRDLERRYGMSRSSLSRHSRLHIPVSIAKAEQVKEQAVEEQAARDVSEELSRLQREADRILKEAREYGQLRTALAALRELRYIADLQLRSEELAGMEQRLAALEEERTG